MPRPPRRNTWEDDEQRALVEWYSMQYPKGPLLVGLMNGDKWTKGQAGKAKGMGMVPGMPDMVLLAPSLYTRPGLRGTFTHHGLFIELKATSPITGRTGRLSETQKAIHPLLERWGYKVVTCVGWQEAANKIKEYMEGVDG